MLLTIVQRRPLLQSLGHEVHECTWSVCLRPHGTARVVKTGVPFTTFIAEAVGAASGARVLLQD